MMAQKRRNIAVVFWCFLWMQILDHQVSEASTTTAPSDHRCDSLSEIAERLWTADSNRLSFSDVATSSSADIVLDFNIGTKLFKYVDETKLSSPLYEALNNLRGFYNPEPHVSDYLIYPEEVSELLSFLELLIATPPMIELVDYLTCRGLLTDRADIQSLLLNLWFTDIYRYGELSGPDSSGFEHTFVGEFADYYNDVVGLHDWYRLYELERDGDLDYTGFIGLSQPNLLEVSFTWAGYVKNVGAVLLGFSIEFQMAIYTLCYMEMPGSLCPLTMGGRVVTLKTVDRHLTTIGEIDSDGNPTIVDRGRTIEAAYPVSTSPTTTSPITSETAPINTTPTACDSLSEISEKLWTADSNRLSFSDAATSSSADIVLDFSIGTKLFQYVDESKVNNPVYQALQNVIDQYDTTPFISDYPPGYLENSEALEFLDLLVKTPPMIELIDYLSCRGLIRTGDLDPYVSDQIYDLWFPSGFQYTFVGYFGDNDTDVVGLHDWYRLYLLERDGDLNYTSYLGLSEPNLLEVSFTWEDHVNNDGAVLLGSSIEFQMAIYTLCYMEMPGSLCPLTMGGRVVTLMTLDRDGEIEAAYPVSTSPTTLTTTTTTSATTTTATITTTPPTTTLATTTTTTPFTTTTATTTTPPTTTLLTATTTTTTTTTQATTTTLPTTTSATTTTTPPTTTTTATTNTAPITTTSDPPPYQAVPPCVDIGRRNNRGRGGGCEGRSDGDYHVCRGCLGGFYATCSNGTLYFRRCAQSHGRPLRFDPVLGRCTFYSPFCP